MLRVLSCMFMQGNLRAPPVDLSGKTVVVTGPTPGGIGYWTATTLGSFGAKVILGARNLQTAQATVGAIPGSVLLPCDLGDPSSVTAFVESVQRELNGAQLDVLVCNAGVVLQEHRKSAQDVEMTFRVCTLGHFYMIRKLRPKRTVSVTGDIYAIAKGPADPFLAESGQEGYNRACLGRLLLLRELKDRATAAGDDAEFVAVHPGVIATDLMGAGAILKPIMRAMLLTPEQGAQASVLLASCPSEELHKDDVLPYYHNKNGWMQLPASDTAMDKEAAVKLYKMCEELCGF